MQHKTNSASWKHVPSNDIPVDLLSRILVPRKFLQDNVWNHGPSGRASRITVIDARSKYPNAELKTHICMMISQHRGPLCTEEINKVHNRVISLQQRCHFLTKIQGLKNFGSKLLSLNQFLDEQGLVRSEAYNRRHQAIIPKAHHITTLIIEQYYNRNFHAGILATLHSIREKY